MAGVAARRRFLPLFDIAFLGLGDGIAEDLAGLRLFCGSGRELLIATSFSKAFIWYNERCGALTAVAATDDAAQAVLSHLRARIRPNYSNPPAHGAAIVAAILNVPELRIEWERELASMRERIRRMRRLLGDGLRRHGAPRDYSFVLGEKGIFTKLGLTPEQVERLRERHSIYMASSSRINVVSVTEA